MELTQKFVRKQLELLRPFYNGSDLDKSRKGQDAIGKLMQAAHRRDVAFTPEAFAGFEACWATPKEPAESAGCVLYLHGGGYVCGDLTYAKGVGGALAAETGLKVLCPAYRLAPEHPFPAALEDAGVCYRRLLEQGYDPARIVLAGESAGGGLIFSLCLWLKEQKLPLPGGLIALSPWTDLTCTGESYEKNRENDPSMTMDELRFYAESYTDDPENPYVSPLFGNLSELPESLLLVGGDEIMRSDTEALYEKLIAAGCKSRLIVGEGLWHAYVLYGLKERRGDLETVVSFAREVALCPKN